MNISSFLAGNNKADIPSTPKQTYGRSYNPLFLINLNLTFLEMPVINITTEVMSTVVNKLLKNMFFN